MTYSNCPDSARCCLLLNSSFASHVKWTDNVIAKSAKSSTLTQRGKFSFKNDASRRRQHFVDNSLAWNIIDLLFEIFQSILYSFTLYIPTLSHHMNHVEFIGKREREHTSHKFFFSFRNGSAPASSCQSSAADYPPPPQQRRNRITHRKETQSTSTFVIFFFPNVPVPFDPDVKWGELPYFLSQYRLSVIDVIFN